MKTSAMMRCPKCQKTSELDNLHLLDRSFKREWVGLTDEERSQLVTLHHGWNEYGQAIEAKLKEKNNG